MAHNTIIFGFFLFLPTVGAVQASLVRDDDYQMLANEAPRRTFVSMNKLWCAQARPRVAEGALALFKAMPRGNLFDEVHARDTKSCEELGYKLSAGEDPCYPGLQTFYRSKEEQHKFVHALQQTLERYGDRYHLAVDHVNLMDACTCHVDSYALKFRGRSCDLLKKVEASWVHHEPHTGEKIACAGGPFVQSARALAVLKSSEQLPMHQSDQIQPIQCDKLGFQFRPTQENNCFTGLRFWSATKDPTTDALNLKTKRVLDGLVNGGYKNFTEMLGLAPPIVKPNPSCQCAPNSEWGKTLDKSCELRRSHIRDWWKE